MKWIKNLFVPLWSVTCCDRVVYRKNGKLLYKGPREDMPPELRREFDAGMAKAETELDKVRKEFDL